LNFVQHTNEESGGTDLLPVLQMHPQVFDQRAGYKSAAVKLVAHMSSGNATCDFFLTAFDKRKIL
jgi:hypothetical protein